MTFYIFISLVRLSCDLRLLEKEEPGQKIVKFDSCTCLEWYCSTYFIADIFCIYLKLYASVFYECLSVI